MYPRSHTISKPSSDTCLHPRRTPSPTTLACIPVGLPHQRLLLASPAGIPQVPQLQQHIQPIHGGAAEAVSERLCKRRRAERGAVWPARQRHGQRCQVRAVRHRAGAGHTVSALQQTAVAVLSHLGAAPVTRHSCAAARCCSSREVGRLMAHCCRLPGSLGCRLDDRTLRDALAGLAGAGLQLGRTTPTGGALTSARREAQLPSVPSAAGLSPRAANNGSAPGVAPGAAGGEFGVAAGNAAVARLPSSNLHSILQQAAARGRSAGPKQTATRRVSWGATAARSSGSAGSQGAAAPSRLPIGWRQAYYQSSRHGAERQPSEEIRPEAASCRQPGFCNSSSFWFRQV